MPSRSLCRYRVSPGKLWEFRVRKPCACLGRSAQSISRLRAQNMTMPATEPSRAAERSAAAVGTVVGAVVLVPFDGVLVTTASVVVGEAAKVYSQRGAFLFHFITFAWVFLGCLPEPEVERPKGPGPKVLLGGMALGTTVRVVGAMDTPEVVPPTTVMVTDGSTDPVGDDAAPLDEEPDGQPGSTMVDVMPSVTTTDTELCAAARVARTGAKRDEDRILDECVVWYEFCSRCT